jgi:hypothetical protein
MVNTPPGDTPPWWRVGMVWLVLGGPAAVVIAASLTAVVAFRGADVVVSAPVSHRAQSAADDAEVPAVQARNRGAVPARKP